MLRKISAAFMAIIFVLSLTACREREEKKSRITVIAKAVNSNFWHRVRDGADAAATEYNVDFLFLGPENEEDYSAQIELIEGAVRGGTDAIILSAIDYERLSEVVDKAARTGVRILTVDSDVSSRNVSTFIATDNVKAGRVAAEAAVSGFSSQSEIKIGLVNYYESTENGQSREEGFKEYIKSVPNAEIVCKETADSNTESAAAAAERLMTEHPEINVIVGFNEWLTLGVGSAIKNKNAAGRIRAVGFDTNTVSIDMLEKGEMDALIVQNPFAIGYLGVKCAVGLLNGETYSERQYTDVVAVTKENMFDSEIQKLLFSFED